MKRNRRELYAANIELASDYYKDGAYSRDSRRLATAGIDRKIKIWDAQTGQELLALEGHTKQVRSPVFSANDDMLFSGSFDGTVRIWRAATEKEIQARIGK